MLRIFTKSFNQIVQKPLLVFFLYAVGFVLAMLVARPFYVTFLNEANTSVALDKLIEDFDFMIFTDFFHQSQRAFKPFVPLVFVLGLVYLLLNTFFAGGVLDATEQDKFKFPRFFEASAQHFGRFAMLLVFLFIFLMVLVSLAGMFFFIFAAIAEGGSEKDYILWMIPPVLILVYFVGFVVILGDYGRVMLFKSQTLTPYSAFWKAFSYIFKRPTAIALFWVIIVLSIILSVVYLGIDSLIGMNSGLTIFVMFLVQQTFVFARTFLKISTQIAAQNYFEARPIELEKAIVLTETEEEI
ncbi:MAG: hypothetical protein KAX81_03665 [Leadbetterella sp.]|jgi:hypothetical protein|nr:hypothetical protein [Leadbetterella sp.]MBP8156100.1 hypothetical protein [Leadbetterella sp.]